MIISAKLLLAVAAAFPLVSALPQAPSAPSPPAHEDTPAKPNAPVDPPMLQKLNELKNGPSPSKSNSEEPTSTQPARRRRDPAPSPAPSPNPALRTATCGRLVVETQEGQPVGFVRADLDPQSYNIYTITPDVESAIKVTYADHSLTPSDDNSQYPVVGATVFSANIDPKEVLVRGSSNIAALTRTDPTQYGQRAEQVNSAFNDASVQMTGNQNRYPSESAIFYLDRATGEITTQWVNGPQDPFAPLDFLANQAGQLFIGDADLDNGPQTNQVRIFCQNLLSQPILPILPF